MVQKFCRNQCAEMEAFFLQSNNAHTVLSQIKYWPKCCVVIEELFSKSKPTCLIRKHNFSYFWLFFFLLHKFYCAFLSREVIELYYKLFIVHLLPLNALNVFNILAKTKNLNTIKTEKEKREWGSSLINFSLIPFSAWHSKIWVILLISTWSAYKSYKISLVAWFAQIPKHHSVKISLSKHLLTSLKAHRLSFVISLQSCIHILAYLSTVCTEVRFSSENWGLLHGIKHSLLLIL